MRIKISRKESKETIHWLTLLSEANPESEQHIQELINEATEYKKILSTILNKTV